MVGQDRTAEFNELVRVITKSNTSIPSRPSSSPDSKIILAGKEMFHNIRKMDRIIADNQSNYLDLNRFLDIGILYNHCAHKIKANKVWTEHERMKFENRALTFIKDMTLQINELSTFLDANRDRLQMEHDYIRHQRNILQCLKFEVRALKEKIEHLIKARNKAVHAMRRTHGAMDQSVDNLDAFVDDIMQEYKQRQLQDANVPDLASNARLDVVNEDQKKPHKNIKLHESHKKTPSSSTQLEIQTFKQENQAMMKALREEQTEVVAAEQKAAQIIESLNLFIDQVMQQDATVTGIHGATTQSLEQLDAGVGQLEKAKERGKDTRTVFITIVLTLAFSLVFLDWYKS